MRTMTIDQYCNKPEGTFKKFIKQQEEQMKREEKERVERVRKSIIKKK